VAGTRPVLATASSMRFAALTLAIAAIMISTNLLFMVITKVAGKKAAKKTV
jgi:hypothetical protein